MVWSAKITWSYWGSVGSDLSTVARARILALSIVFLAASPTWAIAQGASAPALQAELDSIYQKLLVDPSDQALNRRMVEVALSLNDYDAAIGAVERLIFYNPNDADLQLEAARLYVAIDSYAAAAGYLSDALALPGLTSTQRQDAETLLASVNRKTRPSPWAGFGQVGARYQSNANQGSVALGLDEPLPFDKPVSDWNSFALGTLGLSEPVGDNVIVEASVSGYYADQDKVDRLDLGFAEATFGPRFLSENGTLEIKPYALVQGFLLAGHPYESAVGGGIVGRVNFADGWWVGPQFEYKDRLYYNTGTYPTATDNNGDLYTYAVNANAQISDNVTFLGRFAFNDNHAKESYKSYDQYFGTIALEIDFSFLGRDNWVFSSFASGSISDFEGVAPTEQYADLKTKRHDQQWSVGAGLEVPFNDQAGLGVAVEYTKNDSNLDRFKFENFQFVVGPQGRF